jgi:peptidoglycan/LPS O-acetylase OafA/YrhL
VKLRGGLVLVAIAQEPQSFEPASPDDTFRAFVDVAGIAIPLAAVVLISAMSWPGMKRWVRHRVRRHRRRKRNAMHRGTSAAHQ